MQTKADNTVQTIVKFALENHPELFDTLLVTQRLKISQSICNYHQSTVAYGPFKGLRFPQSTHWGSLSRGAMTLGIYEKEVLDKVTELAASDKIFIDLGAADGYYAIGVLVNGLYKKTYCYEIEEKGQSVIRENAKINNVQDRITVQGKAEPDFYKSIPPEELKNSVVLVDIEGAEFDLFDESVFAGLKDSHIIIELHEWLCEDGDRKLEQLLDAAQKTHSLSVITMGNRNLADFPELRLLDDSSRWLICSEGRGRLMQWLVLEPLH